MSYYILPWGRRAKFTVQDAKGRILAKIYGKEKCGEPFRPKKPPPGFEPGSPAYEAITVNGTIEIIEHRKVEPIFYVTDDASVRRQIEAANCNWLGEY